MHGWEINRIISISDSKSEIISAIDESLNRADLVIMTGGLGPTKDDITKHTLCTYFSTELVFHEPTFQHVSKIFKRLNREVSEVNKLQAYVPANCIPLFNTFGTAPGMWFDTPRGILISLPGVPYEMKEILTNQVFPKINNLSNDVVLHKTLMVLGFPESEISQQISDIEDNLPNELKLAYLPHYRSVRLRITAKGNNEKHLQSEVKMAANKIKNILGDAIISDEGETVAEVVGRMLRDNGETVSLAESCTGGYLAHLITSVPGSSTYFPGSVVTYSYENKTEQLGVDSDMLWKQGAVSQEVVEKMAASVRQKMNATYGVAISGIAGPSGGTEDKPVGTVWMAVATQNEIISKVHHLGGDRIQNIERSANLALEMLLKVILENQKI